MPEWFVPPIVIPAAFAIIVTVYGLYRHWTGIA